MAKYIGPKCKLARREKMDLDLKSASRPLGEKCNLSKAPGEHGSAHKRLSSYGVQLREKQKIKRTYGVLEHQFKKYYFAARKSTQNSGEEMLCLLERRLDNLVYRMGFAKTRAHARQIVSHKCVLVNDQLCNIPSRLLKAGDKVAMREAHKTNPYIIEARDYAKSSKSMSWLDINYEDMVGSLLDLPQRAEMTKDFNEQLVIELYSGKK
jgi:small subunit ribosomal protein S4